MVTEFFTGAVEIGAADIDDGVIDQGLELVRRLWDAAWPTGTSSRAT